MPRNIESTLEQALPVLKKAHELDLLTDQEVRIIVKKRRDFEYALTRPLSTRKNFLEYAAFEKGLTKIIKRRAAKRKRNTPSLKDEDLIERLRRRKTEISEAHAVVGKTSSRVNFIYSRALHRFPGDSKLWIHYAKHCIDNEMLKAAAQVFMQAIALCGNDENVWLAAITFHFDHCGDTRAARAVAQRSLRMLPKTVNLWLEYFRMELYYLARLTTRRYAIGVTPGQEETTGSNENEVFNKIEGGSKGTVEDGDGRDMSNRDNSKKPGDTGKLAFWDGGVPLSVLKGACKKASLSELHCAQFYNIVTECPLVPANLLTAMVQMLRDTYPSYKIVDFLSERVKWDSRRAQLDRNVAAKKGRSNWEDEQALAPSFQMETDVLTKMRAQILADMTKIAREQESLRADGFVKGSVREALYVSLTNLKDTMIKFNETDFDFLLFQELKEALLGADDNAMLIERPNGITAWDAKTLVAYLARGNDELDISSEDLSKCMRRLCLQPFRTEDADRALCLYLAKDLDATELLDIFNALRTLPPVTMRSLTALARALIRLASEDKLKDTENHSDWYAHIREVLLKASFLSDAKQDVPFWLVYLNFERGIAKDAKRSSEVNAKAMRALNNEYLENFVERQTLANLR